MLNFILLFMLLGFTNPTPVCPEDSLVIQEQCFDFHNSLLPLTYRDALNLCKEEGKSLPVVKDLHTMRLLVRMQLKKKFGSYWIGMNRNDNTWFYTSDGSTVNLTEYMSYNDNYENKCAAMLAESHLNWAPQICSEQYFYICQYHNDTCTDKLQFSNNCYTLSSQISDYDSAVMACQQSKGKLAEIRDNATYEYLIDAIRRDESWKNTTEGNFPKYYTDTNLQTMWLEAYFDTRQQYWDNSSITQTSERCLRSHNLNRIVEECDRKHFAICQLHTSGMEPPDLNSTVESEPTNSTAATTSELTENDPNDSELVVKSENTTSISLIPRLFPNTKTNISISESDNVTVSDNDATASPSESSAGTVDWQSFMIIVFVPAGIVFLVGILIICAKMCTTCQSKKQMKVDLPVLMQPLVDTRSEENAKFN